MKIGEKVVTKNSGVCEIVSIETMNFGIGEKTYYILKSCFDGNNQNKIYIPEDKLDLIRPLMSKEEVLKIIDSMPEMESVWYSDQKIRKAKFEEIYKSGNVYDICQLLKSLYLHNEKLKQNKQTMSMLDREYFQQLKNGIYQEFSLCLSITYDELDSFIFDRIKM